MIFNLSIVLLFNNFILKSWMIVLQGKKALQSMKLVRIGSKNKKINSNPGASLSFMKELTT
jgi:hypothetical protein